MTPENVSQLGRATGGAGPGVNSSGPLRRWLLALLLATATLVLYWPVVHHDFINYDDGDYVYGNVHVTSGLTANNITWAFSHTVTGNWHPLTMMSHMLDCTLFGLHAGGHHLTSALFHAANTALVFLLLCRLTGAFWRSALVAAWFGWHPVNVESVAWVAERKSVLSLFWGLLALWFYARHAQRPAPAAGAAPGKPGHRDYWLAFLCLALGLMSKPVLVTWPFVMLLLDYWPLQRFRRVPARRLLWEKIPFLIPVALMSVATILTHRQEGDLSLVGGLPPEARMENSLVSYGRYLGEILWPAKLAVFYPHPVHWPMPTVALAAFFLVAVTALAFARRRGEPYLLAGWLWYVGTLVPVIGLVQVGRQAMADRHAYIPEVGIMIALVWGAFDLVMRPRQAEAPEPGPVASGGPASTVVPSQNAAPGAGLWAAVMAAAGVAALVMCLLLTRRQLAYWRDSETLFRHALAVTQNNFVAHYNLGIQLDLEGRLDDAINEYQATIRLQPAAPSVRISLGGALARQGRLDDAVNQLREAIQLMPRFGLAHENLGHVLLAQGHTNAAIQEYEQGIRFLPPEDLSMAHYNLAVALGDDGQIDRAIREYQEAIRLNSDYAAAHRNLAGLLGKTGQTEAATREWRELLRRAPDDADAHFNLGNSLLDQGRFDQAINEFRADLRVKPDDADAHYNLGKALLEQGQADTAVAEFQAAFRLKKYDASVHYNVGNLLAKKGLAEAAIAEFQEAVQLKPEDADARNNLGNLLAKTGRTEAAINELQQAVRLKPEDAGAHYNLGNLLLRAGRLEAAITELKVAVARQPALAPAHYNLAVAFDKKGDATAAIAEFKEAIRWQPDYAIAHNSLGIALAAQGRYDEAISEFEAALRIQPDYAGAQNNLARTRALKAK